VKIWVDADAAPREVKEIIFRAAKRLKVETVLVANQSQFTPPGASYITSITVRDGANVADAFIVTHSEAHDVVVTADIPLAALLVEKGVVVIDPRGDEYSANNIRSRLSVRDYMDQARGAGNVTGGSRPYGERDKAAFASTFDRLLTRSLKASAQIAERAKDASPQASMPQACTPLAEESQQIRPDASQEE
jgi:uncharacterized protein